MAIKEGDIIKVEYVGTLEDGSVFDSTEANDGEALKFEVGSGMIIPGFEKSVIGKEVGDNYDIHLEPSEAYGEYQEGLIKQIPKDKFPNQKELKQGMMIALLGPNNEQIPATVKEINDESVKIDLNHPLAGKSLNFEIKIVETGCEPDKGHSCGCGCC
ncbi:MAG: FKBP-type peptidyl-prolyl cis-trans isomerase [Promethearchaeota archaeon]|nr:MAG: FKBP-type peptidyl-prolyl cis-trans isomerase [Candidatus Lokiarchaeota archaeon]